MLFADQYAFFPLVVQFHQRFHHYALQFYLKTNHLVDQTFKYNDNLKENIINEALRMF